MPDMHNVADTSLLRYRAAAMAALLLLATAPAWAQSCDARSPQTQFAREDLQRALTDADFAIAQDYSERARRELKHLAVQSARCDCAAAQAPFEAAAAKVRVALDTETRKDLREAIKLAIPPFDEAMKQLKDCARR
jgi:hypothetical protein